MYFQSSVLKSSSKYSGGDKKRIVYGTRVLYDYTRLILGLDSISLNVQIT